MNVLAYGGFVCIICVKWDYIWRKFDSTNSCKNLSRNDTKKNKSFTNLTILYKYVKSRETNQDLYKVISWVCFRESVVCCATADWHGAWMVSWQFLICGQKQLWSVLTLSLLMLYICGAPCKARNFNVVYIYIYGHTFDNAESRLSLFAAQCFNTESMQKGILCHICV
jgi:hypothetical protein